MSCPASAIHSRIEAWRKVLAGGTTVKEKFTAGAASVAIVILPDAAGDLNQGLTVLEQRLVAAVSAAQSLGTKFEVTIKPTELLGLSPTAEVRGPNSNLS
ncbi:MAG: hypothetical protein ABIK86_02950 [candidate division WOR-3 bacterium]